MGKYLLGVDLGTSSIKLVLLDKRGKLIQVAESKGRVSFPNPGWAEIAPQIWWKGFKEALDKLVREADIRRKEIISVGVTSLCPALIAFSHSGEVLHPAITYLDRRSTSVISKFKEDHNMERIFRHTGNSISPGTISVSNIMWLREKREDIFKRTAYFGHGNSYLVYKLTGNLYFDHSNASLTGLYDNNAQEWSDYLCDQFGVSRAMLPPIIASSSSAGKITKSVSKMLGLRKDLQVAIGGADTACSAFYLGITEDGELFETTGSSSILAVCSDTPTFDPRFLNRSHVTPGKWLLQGAMSTTGSSLKWFRDEVCNASEDEDFYRKMSRKMSKEGRGGGSDLVFLPYMAGERSPIWDPKAKGVFFGLNLETTRVDMYRAILEGISFGIRQIAEIIEEDMGKKIETVCCTGKGADNQEWTQIKANILKRTLYVPANRETAASGAAVLGGIAGGVFKSPSQALSEIAPFRKIEYQKSPEGVGDDRYERLYKVYRGLYPTLRNYFKLLP